MISTSMTKHVRRALTAAAAGVVAAICIGGSAEAGISNGAAVGLGLGSFALGTAVGSAANPYNNPYYNPYGYYPPPPAGYYAPPAPAYSYPQRSCWDPYYRRYYAC
jgi:hypothetical protein